MMNLNYNWESGENTAQIQVENEGVFSLTVVDANNCISSDTIEAFFAEPLQLNLTSNVELICPGDSVLLSATGASTYSMGKWIRNTQ